MTGLGPFQSFRQAIFAGVSAAALCTILHTGFSAYRDVKKQRLHHLKPEDTRQQKIQQSLTGTQNLDDNHDEDDDDKDLDSDDVLESHADDDEGKEGEDEANPESYLEANFKSVLTNVNIVKLTRIAVAVRMHQLEQEKGRSLTLVEKISVRALTMLPICGAYNVAYRIVFDDSTVWFARVPGHGARFQELDCEKMDIEYRTMQYIRNHTTIPMPIVHYWTTSADLIGVPFGIISEIKGEPLLLEWDDMNEHERLSTLKDIAGHIAKLRFLSFDQLGMLRFADGSDEPSVGSRLVLHSQALEDEKVGEKDYFDVCGTESYGPYQSELAVYEDAFDRAYRNGMEPIDDACLRILRKAVETMPAALFEEKRFCLNMPDLGFQNIFVDVKGKVTGFIDWDCVGTKPSTVGFAQMPIALTLDWNPAYYEYDPDDDDCMECSPADLECFRNYYSKTFADLMNGVAGYDPRMTSLSHVVQAVNIAIKNDFAREWVVSKKLLTGAGIGFSLEDYGRDMEDGDTSEKNIIILDAFSRAWSNGWAYSEPLSEVATQRTASESTAD